MEKTLQGGRDEQVQKQSGGDKQIEGGKINNFGCSREIMLNRNGK